MIKENPGSAPATSTVVYIQSDSAPRDYVIWSLFNTLFMNSCCLGFIAYIYSVKARDKKMAGDVIGATTYASKAKRLNICAVVIFALMFIITIISFVVLKKNVGSFRFSCG